jgi:hypothetical protein
MFADFYSLRLQLASFGSLLIGSIVFLILVGASSTAVLEAAPAAAVRPALVSPAPTYGCGQYVTGDLVGESNPVDVLASLCGFRSNR